jgi:hypothetical protein
MDKERRIRETEEREERWKLELLQRERGLPRKLRDDRRWERWRD